MCEVTAFLRAKNPCETPQFVYQNNVTLYCILPVHQSYKRQTLWKHKAPRPHHRQSCSDQR